MAGWGGKRPGAGRKPNPAKEPVRAEPKLRHNQPETLPAEVAKKIERVDQTLWMEALPILREMSERYGQSRERTQAFNPFRLPTFPEAALPPKDSGLRMAMDNVMTGNSNGWLAGEVLAGVAGEGLLFLGYTYLSELAQRPEYRVIAETIADDATRKWITFDVTGDEKQQAEEKKKDPDGFEEKMLDPDERKKRVAAAGKTDKVKQLEDDQQRLEMQSRFYDVCRNDGLFGRSHLFFDFGSVDMNDPELTTPIGSGRDLVSKSKVNQERRLLALKPIEPVWTYPLMYNANNPLRHDWYNPQVWYVMGQQVHGSRLPCFVGHPVPDILKPAYAFGGLSLTQMAQPYVDIWLTTRQSVALIVKSFSVMVLKTDLSTLLAPNSAANLMARVAMWNMFRDNQGAFVLNKDSEDFANVSAPLGSLDKLQAQSQEHMAAVSRIPLVKLTGISPSGLNATSEQEIEVYDDTIMAYQKRFMSPQVERVINFQQLSLFGDIDPEISWRWAPLREMSQAEKGQKQKDDADRDTKYIDAGVLAPEEVRKRIADDPDMPYADIDPDDVPEPPQEEGLDEPHAQGGGEGDDKPPDKDKGGFASDEWNESDHPRGQPGNAGQFGSGGAGSTGQNKNDNAARAAEGKKPRQKGTVYALTSKGETIIIKDPNFAAKEAAAGRKPAEKGKVYASTPDGKTIIINDPNAKQMGESGGAGSTGENKAGKLATGKVKNYKPGLAAHGIQWSDEVKKKWREEAPQDLESLARASIVNQKKLADVCDAIAAKMNGKFKNPGPKSRGGLEEKITVRGKPAQTITDGVRGGYDVATPEEGDAIIQELSKHFEVADEGWQKTPAGYFDRKTMVRFDDGQVGEIQMWPPGMFNAKKEQGHKLYEQWRILPSDSTEAAGLLQKMVALYAVIEDNLSDTWKTLFRPMDR